MKTYQADQLKNIALIGNASAGKTILAESMLFNGGVIDRRGTVEAKNTASDYNPVEQEQGNSVFSSVLHTTYNDKKINIVDAPGLDDFNGGTYTALTVTETAVQVINAQNGVEVGTEISSRLCEKYNRGMIIALNQLDHDKANYEKSVESLKQSFGGKVVIVQFPINPGNGFNSVIDVMKMKMLSWEGDTGKFKEADIPAEHMDQAKDLQNELIEAAASNDDALMEIFFEKETLTEDEMRKGIVQGLTSRGMFPLFCTSAKNNVGVDRLMEFIVNSAPTAQDLEGMKTKEGETVKYDPDGKTSLFFFKTTTEQHVGEVNYFKVVQGKVDEAMDLVNVSNNTKERIAQLFAPAGKKREKASQMVAGDIGATVKLKNTKYNQTLNVSGLDVEYQNIPYPEPKYRAAIKAVNEADEEKLSEALSRLKDEDPNYQIEYSKELKQIIIGGQGEYHLNILKWHMDNIFKIETQFESPKIPYRETITKVAESSYRHKKQSGGAGQFGEVYIVIEPHDDEKPDPEMYKVGGKEIKVTMRGKEEINLNWGGKLIFYNSIVGGSIDARFLPAILKGIMEKMEEGPLTGCYARDIRVAVYDGKMHPVDSNEISFKLAGLNAFKQAFKNAGPKIMEPIYKVEVLVPSDRMGDVMSDLQGRRAMIEGMSSEGGFEKINARVPLAELDKYSTALSSLSAGRATYSMSFLGYEQVPPDVQEKLLKAYEAEQAVEE
jgi:elongation factor G